MPPCLKRIQPMPNVPLAYVNVWVIFFIRWHTLVRYATVWQDLYETPFAYSPQINKVTFDDYVRGFFQCAETKTERHWCFFCLSLELKLLSWTTIIKVAPYSFLKSGKDTFQTKKCCTFYMYPSPKHVPLQFLILKILFCTRRLVSFFYKISMYKIFWSEMRFSHFKKLYGATLSSV